MRASWSLVGLALVGCQREVAEERDAGWMDPPEAVGVRVTEGSGEAELVARAVSEHGIAVASDSRAITVDGAPVDVDFDPYGYGVVALAPGSHAVEALEPVSAHVVGDLGADLGLLPAAPAVGDATAAVAATGGSLVATTSEVWWVDGHRSHPVLSVPAGQPVADLVTGHLDSDGVLDAVVAAGDTVFVLRGRPDGGMAWGGGVQRDGLAAVAVAVADLSGDELADFAVAWSTGAGGELQVWEGEDLFRFGEAAAVTLDRVPTDLTAGDAVLEGRPQLTVLHDDGEWSRYVRTTDAYEPTGPVFPLELPPGSTIASYGDTNGDGADELVTAEPLVPGEVRPLLVYDLVQREDDAGNVVSYRFVPIEPVGAHLAAADVAGDGRVDLLALERDADGVVTLMQVLNDDGYRQKRVATLTGHGPLAASDLDGDDLVDLLVAGPDAWATWPGATREAEGTTWWAVDEPTGGLWDLGLTHAVAADVDGDPETAELVLAGGGELSVVRVSPGEAPTLDPLGSVAVDAVVDLAACGDVAWVLTDAEVLRVPLGDPGALTRLDAAGERIACAGVEAAVLHDGAVRVLDAALTELETADAPGARDLALASVDGAPVWDTCDTDGCRIVAVDLLADVAFAVTDADGTRIHQGDDTAVHPSVGWPSVGDANGDGLPDLVVTSADGRVAVHLSTGDALGAARLHHGRAAPVSAALPADVTGDAEPELLFVDGDGALRHTGSP